jgi:hypothetical protein
MTAVFTVGDSGGRGSQTEIWSLTAFTKQEILLVNAKFPCSWTYLHRVSSAREYGSCSHAPGEKVNLPFDH